ncbi:MAG: arabinosyltransferase [Pseudonocardiaceae bacterium]|nr:arabinosyltransferase [Pseudonocardiaceae bacterium]
MSPSGTDSTSEPAAEGSSAEDTAASAASVSNGRRNRWRWTAAILGLIAGVCALAVPFMPIAQDTAKIIWPDGNNTRSVNAPLTGYWAQDMRVAMPCTTMQSADARTDNPAMLFSTVPKTRSEFGAGMQLRVQNNLLTVVNRGQQVAEQPLAQPGCDVAISSEVTNTKVSVGGKVIYNDNTDVRPRVIGIYSDIQAEQDPIDGMRVSIAPDTRYQSTPTVWKTAITIIGALALIGSLIAVNRSDIRVARRAPRWAPIGWWRLTPRDLTVLVALGVWVIIGPVTSDDGYILSMARVREDIGYLTNYYRWFGVAEAPFGWFYHLYELMAHFSTAPPWMRLPSFVLGALSWFLISREVTPRLGTAVRTSRAAGWAAAAVFLIWWLPYNNGLRPEPVAAAGSLLALTAVERALVTRRLLPLCLGLIAAAFTVAATPTGPIAVAPFLVSARPLSRLVRSRAREGWLPLLGPIFGAGFCVLFVVFADQTFATVMEASRLRDQVGPSLGWFQEFARYELLFSETADGSVSRRFPVLLILLCTFTCLAVLLRRGRIPGAALGPSRRLIGTVALFFPLLALTPTKWTHHFGAFASVGAAIAALTALATSSTVLRSHRNRMAFLAGLLAVTALAATGPNSYWLVSKFGVPWNDIPPALPGITFATILLIGAGVAAAIAFVENIRAAHRDSDAPEKPRKALVFGSMGLVAVCAIVAAAEVGSMAKAIHKQRSSYSLGGANFAHLTGSSCNLSDHVMVERDPNASVLPPLPPEQQRTASGRVQQAASGTELPPLERTPERVRVGFHTAASAYGDPIGKPPHGLKRGKTPMWSSFREKQQPTGQLRTDWYRLPVDAAKKQAAISVAGKVNTAVSIRAEFGKPTPDGIKIVRRAAVPIVESETSQWADTRFPAKMNRDERMMRLVVEDNDLTEEGWVALTAPRVPKLTTLTQRLGDEPAYLDWPAGFMHPCIKLAAWHDGIAEVPKYRITASPLAGNDEVSSNMGGGPLGWLEEVANQPEVPSYVKNEPGLTWGQLLEVEPYARAGKPRVVRGEEIRPGWWSPGPGPLQADGLVPTR